MRAIWAGVAATLVALLLATTAWAQNGLERFEKELKPQFEFKSFTYANAAPLGSAGFVLNDVVAVIPANAATGDKESTVKIQKVTVDALDFDRLKKDAKDNDAPRFAKLKLEGMTGDDEMFTALQPYGVPNVPLDIALDYTIDPATKVLDLKTLEIAMRGQAKFVLSLAVDGVSDMAGAKDDARLRTASLTVDDTGLLAKLLPAWAKEEGVQPEEFVQTALTGLAAFAAQQGPDTLKSLDAVASFITDWKAPKGSLVLGLKPAKGAGLSDLDKVAMPDALTTEFGFTATYPGTKAGAAKAGAK
ncbi:hypothetical protein [Reyranella soli]|uniref:DUF2125 domain-containing protein n=1 Tax=Reyranella soli TaxID=1230389 RepID=A0A512NQE2_9HYPH|nr:hypothetical protein [Reyranella soli]GEP61142.1 hypothetical protein RSO01_83080 [Reyranella soli]